MTAHIYYLPCFFHYHYSLRRRNVTPPCRLELSVSFTTSNGVSLIDIVQALLTIFFSVQILKIHYYSGHTVAHSSVQRTFYIFYIIKNGIFECSVFNFRENKEIIGTIWKMVQ
ncbi:unnamed protein product [Acanthoscelides obtectus]|uniref:Uncharacterized protein n=1 Tax=Acanthoscelides obtectus TaxID=200917 RepID=A0A9P0LZV3_ACAOB|nr:unnamed protein product [Acanthoscelides obtectus]CAK1670917.1 hypothetical protein AOBTE_LOCUS27917 [Acanthoscelides obtectus]